MAHNVEWEEICQDKKANLKKHVKYIHQFEKKFVCTVCGNKFATSFNLNRHAAVHEK